ncbi:hypothetical protein VTN96DRAFT_9543 [Rasamsonia emersonii]
MGRKGSERLFSGPAEVQEAGSRQRQLGGSWIRAQCSPSRRRKINKELKTGFRRMEAELKYSPRLRSTTPPNRTICDGRTRRRSPACRLRHPRHVSPELMDYNRTEPQCSLRHLM